MEESTSHVSTLVYSGFSFNLHTQHSVFWSVWPVGWAAAFSPFTRLKEQAPGYVHVEAILGQIITQASPPCGSTQKPPFPSTPPYLPTRKAVAVLAPQRPALPNKRTDKLVVDNFVYDKSSVNTAPCPKAAKCNEWATVTNSLTTKPAQTCITEMSQDGDKGSVHNRKPGSTEGKQLRVKKKTKVRS